MRRAIGYGLKHSQPNDGDTEESTKKQYTIFITMVGEAWKGVGRLPNVGDPLSNDTTGVGIKNYAPDKDGFKKDKERLHRINDENPCILAIKKYIPRSVAREGGKRATRNHYQSIKVIDAITVTLPKDNYQKHFSNACAEADISKAEGYLISVIILGFHAKLYGILNKGKRLPVIIPSANARDKMFDERVQQDSFKSVIHTTLIELCGYVPHGECVVCKKYLLCFDEETLKEFGHRIACFLSHVFKSFDLTSLTSSYSKVYLKFSGLLFMSNEEKEDLKKMKKKLIEKFTEHVVTMHEDVKMSIDRAFDGETLTNDDLEKCNGKFAHVMKAASVFATLNNDGSNVEDVRARINEILSQDVSRDTLSSRWDRFLERCKVFKPSLYHILHEAQNPSLYQRARESIAEANEDFNMSIYDALEAGILTEKDMSPLYARFEHVMKAAEAASKLELDGSNIKSVYDDIDKIFSKGVVAEETIRCRWDTFLQRCMEQDDFLYKQLFKERGGRTIAKPATTEHNGEFAVHLNQ
ncbi:hypothetical protein ACHAWC_007491 [Mediolabrus comicus]